MVSEKTYASQSKAYLQNERQSDELLSTVSIYKLESKIFALWRQTVCENSNQDFLTDTIKFYGRLRLNMSTLKLRRVAIDTYKENVAYLHRDCALYHRGLIHQRR